MLDTELMKTQRKTLRLSQAQVAAAVGRDRSTVTSWELGRQRPDVDVLPALAAVLQLTIEQLLGAGPTAGEPAGDRQAVAS